MNREQFEARLNELLDRRIAPEADPEVLRVAEQFTECREVLGAYRALFEGVAEMDLPRPPADLARKVMTQWRREKVSGRYLVAQRHVVRGATSRSALFAAAAALLLVGPGLGWLWQRSGALQAQATKPLQPSTDTAANDLAAITPANTHPIAVTPDTGDGTIVANLPAAPTADSAAATDNLPADNSPAPATEVASAPAAESSPNSATAPRVTPSTLAAGQFASLLPSQRPSGDSTPAAPAESGSATAGTPTSDGAAWVGEVSQGFQPIAESAAGALDFLLEVLADGSDDTRG